MSSQCSVDSIYLFSDINRIRINIWGNICLMITFLFRWNVLSTLTWKIDIKQKFRQISFKERTTFWNGNKLFCNFSCGSLASLVFWTWNIVLMFSNKDSLLLAMNGGSFSNNRVEVLPEVSCSREGKNSLN